LAVTKGKRQKAKKIGQIAQLLGSFKNQMMQKKSARG
jgi:hypothetical protein